MGKSSPLRFADSIAQMQALVGHDDKDLLFVFETTDFFVFRETNGSVHDGDDVVKPDNVLATNTGRWIRQKFTASDLIPEDAFPDVYIDDTLVEEDVTKINIQTNGTDADATSSSAGEVNIKMPTMPTLASGLMPSGAVLPYAGPTAPDGYLLCYGQAVSRATFADLFDAVGETYGSGDGGTTFNIPDLRGRFALGKDNMGGASANRVTDTDADALAGSGGAETHTLTEAQMPAHTHTTGDTEVGAEGAGATDPTDVITTAGTGNVTGSTGSGQAHPIMNPFLTLNYIIKT